MHLKPTLLIIADDLTGANDAGVQCAVAGVRSVVLANPWIENLPPGYPVIVVNTESRHLPAQQAADRVQKVATIGRRAGIEYFFKKTDSTLRGNIGAELEALLGVTGALSIPFVPALPDLGRTTEEGIHYVHGTPISDTAFARDPLNPVRHSHVTEVLRLQTKCAVCHGKPGLVQGEGIIVLDCATNEDLAEIAGTLASTDRLRLLAGSVGVIRHLVEHIGLRLDRPEPSKPLLPMLLVNGSVNERALEQIALGAANFAQVRLTPAQLIGRHAQLTIPKGGGNLLLYSITSLSDLSTFKTAAEVKGLTEKQLYLHVAEQTGQIVRQILAAGVFRTVIIFGGDTLAGVARANHWTQFEPVAEMEAGVSICVPVGSDLTLITKAGGFGDADTVNRIVRYLEESTHAVAH